MKDSLAGLPSGNPDTYCPSKYPVAISGEPLAARQVGVERCAQPWVRPHVKYGLAGRRGRTRIQWTGVG